MHSSTAFLLIPVESMNYPQGTFLHCVPHCNKTVHNWFQVHKHTLVKYPKCQCREQGSTLEGSWKSCNSFNSSVFAISALAYSLEGDYFTTIFTTRKRNWRMISNTRLSELQAGIRHHWPETHIIYTEGLMKGSGTFNTFRVAPILQVSRNTAASPGRRCYLCS